MSLARRRLPPGALRAAGVASEGGVTANRFSLAPSRIQILPLRRSAWQEDVLSRLVLVSQNVLVTECPIEMEVDTVAPVPPNPPDSHELRYRRVRQAMQRERRVQERQVEVAVESTRRLARRVGTIDGTEIPREIRRHQWSVLNDPLLWAAAEDTRHSPVLVWLSEVAQVIPNVNVAGVEMGGREGSDSRLGSVAGCDAQLGNPVSRTSG